MFFRSKWIRLSQYEKDILQYPDVTRKFSNWFPEGFQTLCKIIPTFAKFNSNLNFNALKGNFEICKRIIEDWTNICQMYIHLCLQNPCFIEPLEMYFRLLNTKQTWLLSFECMSSPIDHIFWSTQNIHWHILATSLLL